MHLLLTFEQAMTSGSSCEENRTSAYSEDLRWRIIYHVHALGRSCSETACCLCVDASTVRRTVALFDQTGKVAKRKYPDTHGGHLRKLTDVDKLLVLEIAIERPGIYLREIRQFLLEETGTEVDVSTICRFLKESGFTRQKMTITAKQRSDALRATFLMDMTIYKKHPEFFVFIDETGTDRRDSMRRFGYGLRGKPPVSQKILFRGQRVSTIAAISFDQGLLDCQTVTDTVTGDLFGRFVQHHLSSHLHAFDGTAPRSIVVLDNASVHHADGIVHAIQSTGALVHFLPPYSPDFNPIEATFSKVKSILKANEDSWESMDVETAVLIAFNQITVDDCKAWITHCGYQ